MSEIRVDTISEKTSANGVAIDGLTIKDGGISATTGAIVFNEASADLDFRVESNANANRFKIDGGDDVIVMGTATVEDSIYGAKPALQLTGTDFNSSAFSMIRNAADANSPNLIFGKSRSADGNTVVQDGDDLGNITFAAADGTDQNNTAARIYAEVDGTPGANDTPGRLVLATTADGANSATERVRITSSGKVGIGVTSPAVTLELAGNGGAIRLPTGGELQFGNANNFILGNSGSNFLSFTTNNSERMRISSDGLHIGGTGSANALDDYEEGTWTPTFNGSAGAPSGVNYSIRGGGYTKIGRLVTCHAYLALSSFSSAPSGNAIITGLPFTAADTNATFGVANIGYCDGWSSSDAPQTGYVDRNSTQIQLKTNQSADARDDLRVSIQASNMSGDEVIILNVTFSTA